jgi:hypothetical protein
LCGSVDIPLRSSLRRETGKLRESDEDALRRWRGSCAGERRWRVEGKSGEDVCESEELGEVRSEREEGEREEEEEEEEVCLLLFPQLEEGLAMLGHVSHCSHYPLRQLTSPLHTSLTFPPPTHSNE